MAWCLLLRIGMKFDAVMVHTVLNKFSGSSLPLCTILYSSTFQRQDNFSPPFVILDEQGNARVGCSPRIHSEQFTPKSGSLKKNTIPVDRLDVQNPAPHHYGKTDPGRHLVPMGNYRWPPIFWDTDSVDIGSRTDTRPTEKMFAFFIHAVRKRLTLGIAFHKLNRKTPLRFPPRLATGWKRIVSPLSGRLTIGLATW